MAKIRPLVHGKAQRLPVHGLCQEDDVVRG